jgi:hypothetical protein
MGLVSVQQTVSRTSTQKGWLLISTQLSAEKDMQVSENCYIFGSDNAKDKNVELFLIILISL